MGVGSMARRRDRSLDLFKALLVIGMVVCHCIQLIGDDARAGFWVAQLINLITFSGFMFSFGYAVQLAYFSRGWAQAAPRLLRNCIRTLLAFYVSGIAFETLVNRQMIGPLLPKILTLSHIPGYSEFLAVFLMLNILILLLFVPLKWLASRPLGAAAAAVLSLLATLLPYERIMPNQLGLLIGSTRFASFPVLQYSGYFLAGASLARPGKKLNWKVLIPAWAGSAAFAAYVVLHNGHLPSRFPPSAYWIAGAAGLLCIYWGLAKRLAKLEGGVSRCLGWIGAHTLQFLIGSNWIIFTMKYLFDPHWSLGISLLATPILMAVNAGAIVLLQWLRKIIAARLPARGKQTA